MAYFKELACEFKKEIRRDPCNVDEGQTGERPRRPKRLEMERVKCMLASGPFAVRISRTDLAARSVIRLPVPSSSDAHNNPGTQSLRCRRRENMQTRESPAWASPRNTYTNGPKLHSSPRLHIYSTHTIAHTVQHSRAFSIRDSGRYRRRSHSHLSDGRSQFVLRRL